eukprot:6594905-Alexandrium_andersonii.AAC.1
MDPAGRALLDAVNAATRALQSAVNELPPCSPPLHVYVQRQIDDLRRAAGQAMFADAAAASSAPAPVLPPAGTAAAQEA